MYRFELVSGKSSAPHWVLRDFEENPEEMASAWVIHKSVYAHLIPRLVRDSLSKVATHLEPAGLPTEVSSLIASDLACEYMRNLEMNQRNPRSGRVFDEAESIRVAAVALQRALRASSGATLSYLRSEISITLLQERLGGESREQHEIEQSNEWNRLRRSSSMFFVSEYAPEFLHCIRPAPEFLDSLGDLVRAAEICKGKLSPDFGGPKSGMHDSSCSMARQGLALVIRRILRHLGLPCGSQKEGPVSNLLRLVHESTGGEEATWVNHVAEMVPKLERDWKALGMQG